jgi:hypothetical protein
LTRQGLISRRGLHAASVLILIAVFIGSWGDAVRIGLVFSVANVAALGERLSRCDFSRGAVRLQSKEGGP